MRSWLMLLALALACSISRSAEVELFVTDYAENPSREQKALVDRPITYVKPADAIIKMADGRIITEKSPARVLIQRQIAGDPRLARLFASQGEYEPFSFTLRANEALEAVMISATPLTGSAGRIEPTNIAIASVEEFQAGGGQILMRIGRPWNMSAHNVEFFWCTIKVPAEAKPGTYRGELVVSSKQHRVAAINVELEVLPIKLDAPPFSLGFNYSNPKDPKALAAHLADMREHGMTCVAPLYKFHLPVHDTDTSEVGAFIEAYKQAGFRPPLYFASAMSLHVSDLAGYGSETSKRWQQKYIRTMKLLDAEVRKHDVPVLMSIGDELTNKGVEGVRIAGNLARFVWEELPEIATTSDMNGYMEVMAMAPYLNVATFNNGWDGIDHHNKGWTLINRKFIEEVKKTGAIPWFVNAGSGRFPFGFFFWKMCRHGVQGKVEWYYNLDNERGSLVKTDGARIWPTLDYERCREGIDDLKYICRLEKLIAQAKVSGKATAARQRAEQLLTRISDSIIDDWSAYSSGGQRWPADGFDLLDPEKSAQLGSLNALRREIADRILELQAGM